MIDPRIFRAYDIRGKAHEQLTEEACLLIGRAFGEILQEKYGKENKHPAVVVGRDARLHSPVFEEKIVEGLLLAGCQVFRIGQTPSPINYFTICTKKFDAGVQVTASHNPKEDNGLKLQIRDAEAFSGEDLQDLRRRIERSLQDSPLPSGEGLGVREGQAGVSAENFDAITPYTSFLTQLFPNVGQGKKIVVDAGNGVAGPVYCEVLRKVGCEVIEMYTEPDGNFPNHAADPSKHATLRELQKRVVDEKADCGFAFDGDGDRIGLIDERGAIVTADSTLLLLAKDHLSRHPKAPIIFTVSNSSLLESEVKAWGGVPVMCKVGHSFVEHAMREHGAKLGGEQSGHFFCGEDYFGFDDALVAGLRMLAILGSTWAERPLPLMESTTQKKRSARSGRVDSRVSVLISAFPRTYQTPEFRPHCADEKKSEVVRLATAHFAKKYPVVTLDGARIDFGDGAWAGIRISNTSPCLSICIEARSPKKLKHVESEVLEHLKTYPEVEL